MSGWVNYIDNLTNTGQVAQAAIGGLDGKILANTPEFNVSDDEISAVLEGFENPEKLLMSGIIINRVKYLYQQSDNSQIQGKRGSTGIFVAKSSKHVIISTYISGMLPDNTRFQVERIRDYLLTAGY
jgi:profilin